MTVRMYALATRYQSPGEVDVEWDMHMEFHFWCDRHDLHAWMERLYDSKGGMQRVFWKGRLVLSERDLDQLERHTRCRAAIGKIRCHWQRRLDIDFDDDLYFIVKARQAIRMGLSVVYSAEW